MDYHKSSAYWDREVLANDVDLDQTATSAPDNFLKQGVADASLGAKGVLLQNPEVFFTPKFLHKSVYRSWKFRLGKRKIAALNRSHNLPIP